MAAEFFPVPEYDFDENGNTILIGCSFVVFVDGKLFCSTISESFAIGIVNWFNLYAENKKQEEITACIEQVVENEKLLFDFIKRIRLAYLKKQEIEERERQAFTPEY